MNAKLQFAATLLAAASYVVPSGTAWAQKPHDDRPPQAQAAHPARSQPHPQNAHPNANRPPADQSHSANTNPENHRPAGQNNFNNRNHPGKNADDASLTRRQQLGVGSPRPWVDTMRDLTPAQREGVLQNSRAFQNLSPDKQNKIRQQFNQWDHMSSSQRADLREKEQTWRNLSPEQRDQIKNEVLPKMRQMPWDRQQMINQKLGVLRNMPESARNQRLSDPNFTRGMSDEEKSVLHDLAHMHVGGAPDLPTE